jgi:outer membrane lipopolysaccharide assembly protein LptE/RlpB
MRRTFKLGFAAIITLLLSSCGYHLVRERVVELPAGIKTLAVPLAKNRTIEAGLEDVFTQELIQRLRADGRVPVVEPGRADGELRCVLTELTIHSVSYDKNGRVVVASARMAAECELVKPPAEGAAWRSGELNAVEEYPVGDDYLHNEDIKAQALKQAVQDLSESVRSLLFDRF